ncbi:MAG: RBBP9/YdeN family alpha/beta hydrolase [Hyphomicrobiaceae bacterium]
MRTADVDILIVPGWAGSDDDHWQSRWERNLKTARRVAQGDWLEPDRPSWVERIVEEVGRSERPAMLVAHGLGVAAVLHAAQELDPARVAGTFLVGPMDLDAIADWPDEQGRNWRRVAGSFLPMPMAPLPFPARMIASSEDPYCSSERAEALGAAWGAQVSILAKAGHIDTASGHGPWPEGLLTFGQFLQTLARREPSFE